MARYDAKRIRKREYFRLGPLRQGANKRPPFVIGFDSEADKGMPFLFQWAFPGGTRDDVILQDIPIQKDAGLIAFAEFLYENCNRRDVDYIIFGFNLNYEYTQIFRDVPDDLKNAPDMKCEITLTKYRDKVEVSAMNNKRYSMVWRVGRAGVKVKVIDAMAYFPMSLDAASKMVEVGSKLPKPKRFTKSKRNTPDFVAYAKQDAWLTQLIGEYIISLHRQYDVRTCMSAPHFACSTFRRHFLTTDIEMAEGEYEQYGLDSYHGGHNGYYLDQPAIFPSIWQYDIRSAYPEAMRQLPDIENHNVALVDSYQYGSHGIYEITYRYTGCKYKPLLSREGPPLAAGLHTTRLTSYEIDAALDTGEIEIIKAHGYIMVGKPGGPLLAYVDEFYRMKSTTKNKTERNTAKLFLNSLYGKFFQKVPLGIVGTYDWDTGEYTETDPDEEFDYDAGGLYHPPIASLITGFVRAKIHRLEHKYDAIMTSTDGFFAHNSPDVSDLGEGLGQLDAQRGELRIWRERLYVFDAGGGERKYALHGFRGTVADLLQLPVSPGIYRYTAQSMISLKMSTRTFRGKRYQPGEFAEFAFDLNLVGAPP